MSIVHSPHFLFIYPSAKESGAQGQGIRTAYGLIPNYLEGEKAGSRTSDPSKEESSDVINAENVKKEVNVKTELQEEVSYLLIADLSGDLNSHSLLINVKSS